MNDQQRLDFLEERSRLSRTGITFHWDGDGEYRYMEHQYLGPPCENIRHAIDQQIINRKWKVK